MGNLRQITIAVTTAADGSATAYSSDVLSGFVEAVIYTKNNFDNGSTFTITAETSGLSIWNESNVNATATRYPRAALNATTGGALLYAAGGTAVTDKVPLAGERIKVVIASGGNVKAATFTFVLS